MSKIAKHYEDTYIDYRRIVIFCCILFITFAFSWGLSFFGYEIRIQKDPQRRTDVSSYLENAKKLTIVNTGSTSIEVQYSPFMSEMNYRSDINDLKPTFTRGASDNTAVTMEFNNGLNYGVLVIHGPLLETIEVRGPMDMRYWGGGSITVINHTSTFNLEGSYDTVKAINQEWSVSRLESATIKILDVSLVNGFVTAGTVGTLKAQLPTACDNDHYATSARRTVMVRSISSGTMLFNGVEQTARPVTNDCGKLVVGV